MENYSIIMEHFSQKACNTCHIIYCLSIVPHFVAVSQELLILLESLNPIIKNMKYEGKKQVNINQYNSKPEMWGGLWSLTVRLAGRQGREWGST